MKLADDIVKEIRDRQDWYIEDVQQEASKMSNEALKFFIETVNNSKSYITREAKLTSFIYRQELAIRLELLTLGF